MWHPLFAIAAAHNRNRWSPPLGAQFGAMGQRRMVPAYVSPGAASPLGGITTRGTLTAADIVYLKDRALRFQQVLGDLLEVGFLGGGVLDTQDGRDAVARLAATALAGEDVDYNTGQPSVGYNAAKHYAAYQLVRANVVPWFLDAFPAQVPVPGS